MVSGHTNAPIKLNKKNVLGFTLTTPAKMGANVRTMGKNLPKISATPPCF